MSDELIRSSGVSGSQSDTWGPLQRGLPIYLQTLLEYLAHTGHWIDWGQEAERQTLLLISSPPCPQELGLFGPAASADFRPAGRDVTCKTHFLKEL